MPRKKLETPCNLEHLSILDEHGGLDGELEPELSVELLREMHRVMLLSRRFDERMLSLQRQGRLGTFGPVRGQEASQIGAVATLRETDWVVPSYREAAASLWRGTPLQGILLYNAGFNEGARVRDEQRDLPICIPVGSQMLHAAGLAYGFRVQGRDDVALTFFGDGATSEGDFHEAMNFAAVFECPLVFVCQNNHWAISMPRSRQTRSGTLAQKAFAYGMPGIQVDGNDVLAVYVACKEAVARARVEHVPTLVECVTYRLGVHTTVDDPSKYREEEEVREWERRDPLPRFQRYLQQKGILEDADIQKLEADTDEQVRRASREAETEIERLGDPVVMFEHVYEEMPLELRRQRELLLVEWRERQEAKSKGIGGNSG